MKIHKFFLALNGVKTEETVEVPKDMTDEEVEEEFKEWVWNQLDAYRTEIK